MTFMLLLGMDLVLPIAAIILLYAGSLAVYSHSPSLAKGMVCLCALIIGVVVGWVAGFFLSILVAILLAAFGGASARDLPWAGMAVGLYLRPFTALACGVYAAWRTARWIDERERRVAEEDRQVLP